MLLDEKKRADGFKNRGCDGEDMRIRDFLFGDAKTRCHHAILNDEYISRYDQGSIIKLREIHKILERIESKLPDRASGKVTAGTDRMLGYMKQHAERTLKHLNDLEEHLLDFEKQLDDAKRK